MDALNDLCGPFGITCLIVGFAPFATIICHCARDCIGQSNPHSHASRPRDELGKYGPWQTSVDWVRPIPNGSNVSHSCLVRWFVRAVLARNKTLVGKR